MEPKYYRNWHLRWVAAADEMVGLSELKHAEHVILHVIRMQNRPKSAATIARLLNRDDIPNIQYSLRKLENAELIQKNKEAGTKIYNYGITDLGKKLTDEYSKLRSELLIRNLVSITDFDSRAEDATQLLSIMTGIYEESGRKSASFNRADDAQVKV
jgi:predicted MarR family transcription regulator